MSNQMTKRQIRDIFKDECPPACQLFEQVIAGESIIDFMFVTRYWSLAVFVRDIVTVDDLSEVINWSGGFNQVYLVITSSNPIGDFISEMLVNNGVGLMSTGIKQDHIDAIYFPLCDYNWNRIRDLGYKELFCTALRVKRPEGYMYTSDLTRYLIRKLMYHAGHSITVRTIRDYAFNARVIDDDYVRSNINDNQGFTHAITLMLKSAKKKWSVMTKQGIGISCPAQYIAVIKRKRIKMSV